MYLSRLLVRHLKTAIQINKNASFEQTHYDILGIASNASQNDIKTAYYKLSKIYHPDRNNSQCSDKFMAITLAYEVLGNDKSKKFYDEKLQKLGIRKPDFSAQPLYKISYGLEFDELGQKSMFDYDNWHKKHYEQKFERRADAKRRYQEKVIFKSKIARETRQSHSIIMTISILLLCGLLLKSVFGDNDRLQTKRNK